MNVTIYSDASICNKTLAGGWAGWIKSDRGTLKADNILKNKINDTSIAEAMAAINTLIYAIKNDAIQNGDKVILTTDNDGVMDILEGKASRKFTFKKARKKKISIWKFSKNINNANKYIKEISSDYKKYVKKYNLIIKWAHVKSHTNKNDPRSYINSNCDKRAKLNMKKARKLHYKILSQNYNS